MWTLMWWQLYDYCVIFSTDDQVVYHLCKYAQKEIYQDEIYNTCMNYCPFLKGPNIEC